MVLLEAYVRLQLQKGQIFYHSSRRSYSHKESVNSDSSGTHKVAPRSYCLSSPI